MDIPDPPAFDTNWIKAYFYHPEWDSTFGDNFTQEFQSNLFCGIKEWNLLVEANSQGPLELEFIIASPESNPIDIEIEVVDENDQISFISINASSSTIIQSTIEQNTPKEFLIKVSNTD